MREINDHMKQVIGMQKQPKPSFNPLKWNWTFIVTWSVLGFVAYNIFKFLINLSTFSAKSKATSLIIFDSSYEFF